MIGGLLMGSAEGAAFSGTEAFVRTGLMTGSAVDAVMAGWNGLETGAALGGALGAIFHEVCFAAGMQVDVQDAERVVAKNVEDVLKGDLVVSRDENDPSAPLVLVMVDETFRRLSDHLRNVDIRDASGNSGVIRTTDEHPFFEKTRGRLAARDLRAGDVLMTRCGEPLTVVETHREEHPDGVPVFNFRVPGTHTYFVRPKGWTGDAAWVHNVCTEEELEEIARLKNQPASTLADGSAGYTDSLGFNVRHAPHSGDGHLLEMRNAADELVAQVNGTAEDTIVLYNKTLRDATDPLFTIADHCIKPDVQVFQNTTEGWKAVGLPVEGRACR
jgi:hypothetical protein